MKALPNNFTISIPMQKMLGFSMKSGGCLRVYQNEIGEASLSGTS